MDARAQAQSASAQPPGTSAASAPSPERALPPEEYCLWMILRDNVRAYFDRNVEGKVFLEKIGHRSQMICGSWQDIDGWISLGPRGHRGPYVRVGDGPHYDLEFMCDARQQPERLVGLVELTKSVLHANDERLYRRKLNCRTEEFSYVQGARSNEQ